MAPARKATPHRKSDLEEVRSHIRSRQRTGHVYAALLGLRTYEPLELNQQVREGFRFSAFDRFRRNTNLSLRALSELTQIRLRTLTRRKATGKLDPEESDRLLRASRVFLRALELFEGDDEAALTWLSRPQPALGGLPPLELAKSDVGAKEIEDLIGRLEHGIPS